VSDGQFFVYYILGPETLAVLAGWWAWHRFRAYRARTAWIRHLAAHRRQRRPT
jgi:hypothetical protein